MLPQTDTLERNITPAFHSNSDITRLPANGTASSSDSSMISRTHLHPMTNIDQDRDYSGWDRQLNYPYGVKPWVATEGETTSHDYSCNENSPAVHIDISQEPALNITDPTLCAASRTSFPTNPSSYDLLSGLHVMPGLPSPMQTREEAQWQMYLTASLSNPLDSLSFNTIRSPPSLSYTPDVQNSIEIPEEPQSSVDQFTLPDGAIFGAPTVQPANQLHQLPFSNSPPQLSAAFSVSPVELDYNQGDAINIYPGSDQGHPQRPVETLANGEYVSSVGDPLHSGFDFSSTRIPYSNLASHLSSNSSVPSPKSPPPHYHYPILSHPSPVRPRRGLSGWSGPQSPERPIERPFVVNIHKKRLRSVSPSPVVAFRRPQGSKPISSENSAQTSSVRDNQRSRNSNGRVSLVDESVPLSDSRELEMDSDDLGDDDADSDDYRPSRSPSADLAYLPSYPVQFLCETGTEPSGPSKKKAKRGKGKAKGSAALALAVVTQLGATRSREGSEQFDDDFDPLAVYHEGRHGIRKRKNHPIPLPVPIPNLNKKSRGRKVPFVADLTSSGGSTSPSGNSKGGRNLDDSEGGMVRSSTRSRRKTSRMPTPVTDELAGSRSYVCVVPGCGKCFVRGEHLKRHVRSIHTHDKPHPCPFEGCDKSFSRRDNLGQHVRIHLQP